MAPLPLMKKEKHCKPALLRIKLNFSLQFSNICLNWGMINPDPDRHQNDADPQHCPQTVKGTFRWCFQRPEQARK